MRLSDVAHLSVTQKNDIVYILFKRYYFYSPNADSPNVSSDLQFQKFSSRLATLQLIIVLYDGHPHFALTTAPICNIFINFGVSHALLNSNFSVF